MTDARQFLDLLTTETLYNKSKVSLKLHELEYKLDVENKVLAGIKTMADVMDRDPSLSDRRRRQELHGQMYESIEKLNLLTKALRKYKSLYIGEGDDDDDYGTVFICLMGCILNHSFIRTRNTSLC
jgi:hypothetical protein